MARRLPLALVLLLLAYGLPLLHGPALYGVASVVGQDVADAPLLLTEPAWIMWRNYTGAELAGLLVPTALGSTPSPTVNGSVLELVDSGHVALRLRIPSNDWVIVARVSVTPVSPAKPPRGGVGGYAAQEPAGGGRLPAATYWVSVVEAWCTRCRSYSFQGHLSTRGGRWYYSDETPLGSDTATIWFGSVDGFVAGGVWGRPETTRYIRDRVYVPELVAHHVRLRVYWLAVYIAAGHGERLLPWLPAVRRVDGEAASYGRILPVPGARLYTRGGLVVVEHTRTVVVTVTTTKTLTVEPPSTSRSCSPSGLGVEQLETLALLAVLLLVLLYMLSAMHQ